VSELGYTKICVSIYDEDLAELDAMVARAKARGEYRMSRSKMIRLAVAALRLARKDAHDGT
jgi:metal-responsive CopG/Arc/MetJ family transcriptional regulator